jgi:hypothetical protein
MTATTITAYWYLLLLPLMVLLLLMLHPLLLLVLIKTYDRRVSIQTNDIALSNMTHYPDVPDILTTGVFLQSPFSASFKESR